MSAAPGSTIDFGRESVPPDATIMWIGSAYNRLMQRLRDLERALSRGSGDQRAARLDVRFGRMIWVEITGTQEVATGVTGYSWKQVMPGDPANPEEQWIDVEDGITSTDGGNEFGIYAVTTDPSITIGVGEHCQMWMGANMAPITGGSTWNQVARILLVSSAGGPMLVRVASASGSMNPTYSLKPYGSEGTIIAGVKPHRFNTESQVDWLPAAIDSDCYLQLIPGEDPGVPASWKLTDVKETMPLSDCEGVPLLAGPGSGPGFQPQPGFPGGPDPPVGGGFPALIGGGDSDLPATAPTPASGGGRGERRRFLASDAELAALNS